MPLQIPGPPQDVLLSPAALTQSTFSPFGTVIANPSPSLIPSSTLISIPPGAVQANQGSALKYLNVTDMRDLYSEAPSAVPSKAVMNMFVCAPRSLLPTGKSGPGSDSEGIFPVSILERHPYTTQTFVPLGISPKESQQVRYLVIVAPSLPPASTDAEFPVPNGDALPGRGLPDLGKVKAFIAHGGQAVTYGAGTWHAPMVVLGNRAVDFVVVQFANGVGIEDCQEVEFGERGEGKGKIGVLVKVGERVDAKL
ncbi:ureidoglycolate hydrolase [Cadophora sp. DSE1049]|nr:ureidoglycolate hydrolase [Cadophora sp. DSE1049]